MKISNTTVKGRKSWVIDNGNLSLGMHHGGGNIAAIHLNKGCKTNPLWAPVWKTIEPSAYSSKKHLPRYANQLLASISGHNLCLGWFGDPSESEAAAGMACHGEAPVARWKLKRKQVGKQSVKLTVECELPEADMHFERTLSSRAGSHIVKVKERVTNTSRRDIPFTMCQHVTLGPPFLEKGVTLFDMPAIKGHTFKGVFGKPQRLKSDTAFTWPDGPGTKGETVDLRLYDKRYRVSSDFTTQLIDRKCDLAWFSAVNPRLGLLIAYAWDRKDFPWVGNWEENYGRKEEPWAGKSLTRGMEFANTPFPVGLRAAVDMGKFQGEPTYQWLTARETRTITYSIILAPVDSDVTGVADIRPNKRGFDIDLAI